MKTSITISIYPNKNLSSKMIKKMVNWLYENAKRKGIIIRFHDQVTEIIGEYHTVLEFLTEEIFKLSKLKKITEINFKIKMKFDKKLIEISKLKN